MTKLVIATVGASLNTTHKDWGHLRSMVTHVSEKAAPQGWRWKVVLNQDGLEEAQSGLRAALAANTISARDATAKVPAEVGGLFAEGGPLAWSGQATDSGGFTVRPDPSRPRVVLIASDTEPGIRAAVVVALMLADDIEMSCVGHDHATSEELFSVSPQRASALVRSVKVVVVRGLNASASGLMMRAGLSNLGLALLEELERVTVDEPPDATQNDVTLELALTAGYKSVAALVPQAVGLAHAAMRPHRAALPRVRCSILFTSSETKNYAAIEYAPVEIDLLPSDWARLYDLHHGTQTTAEPATRARLGPQLLDADSGRLTRFASRLVQTRFPDSGEHPLIRKLNGHAGDAERETAIVVRAVSDALDDVEREQTGVLRAQMRTIHESFDRRLGGAHPDPVWLLGAEQIVSKAESREGIRSLRLVPVNELGFQLARARLDGLSRPLSGEADPEELGARAIAAVNRWVVLLRRRPGETAARPYPDLDGHAVQIATRIPVDAADRNLLLHTVVRGALLPQFRLDRAFRAVRCAMAHSGGWRWAYSAAAGLAFTGPTLALGLVALLRGSGWWALSATATIALAVALVSVTSWHIGVAASHAIAPRLLGSCAIGTVVLAGLGDLLGPLLRALAKTSSSTALAIGVIAVLSALIATTNYLLVEMAVTATPTGISRARRFGRVLVVTWLGLQYALAGACVLAPIRAVAINDSSASVRDAFAHPVPFAAIGVVSSLILVIGVLSQLFWQDKTAVDPL